MEKEHAADFISIAMVFQVGAIVACSLYILTIGLEKTNASNLGIYSILIIITLLLYYSRSLFLEKVIGTSKSIKGTLLLAYGIGFGIIFGPYCFFETSLALKNGIVVYVFAPENAPSAVGSIWFALEETIWVATQAYGKDS